MQKLLTTFFLLFSLNSYACKDTWDFQTDKQKHFAGSVVLSAAGTVYFQDPWKGFYFSTAVGVVKELHDFKVGCPSFKDLGYDILGSAVGAYLGQNLFVSPTKIVYFKEF